MVAGFLFVICYPIYWHRKESKNEIDTSLQHAWFRGMLRYWLSISICSYGFGKILGNQFAHSYFRDNSLVKNLSGYDLTWNYFGHSYSFAVIIAILQIGGSLLLLFRRTSLLGAVVLMPIMLNIVLINLFFDIPTAALINALLYTFGLLYLFLLRWKELKVVLFHIGTSLPNVQLGNGKYILRFLVVAYAFAFGYYFRSLKSSETFIGKWQVEKLIRNKDTIPPNAWLTDSTDWKNIYLEQGGSITLNPNPYVIDKYRASRGTYTYNSSLHSIRLMLHINEFKRDTLIFNIKNLDKKHMQWTLVNKEDKLFLHLLKAD